MSHDSQKLLSLAHQLESLAVAELVKIAKKSEKNKLNSKDKDKNRSSDSAKSTKSTKDKDKKKKKSSSVQEFYGLLLSKYGQAVQPAAQPAAPQAPKAQQAAPQAPKAQPDPKIKNIQQMLINSGFKGVGGKQLALTGIMDADTRAALDAFIRQTAEKAQ